MVIYCRISFSSANTILSLKLERSQLKMVEFGDVNKFVRDRPVWNQLSPVGMQLSFRFNEDGAVKEQTPNYITHRLPVTLQKIDFTNSLSALEHKNCRIYKTSTNIIPWQLYYYCIWRWSTSKNVHYCLI